MADWVRKWPLLLAGLLVTPIALAIAFASAGFGHGSYIWARIVLPFASLCTLNSHFNSLLVPLFAILQYPIYGYLFDRSSRKVAAGCVIIAMHAAMVAWLFFGTTDFRYYINQ
ncbi:MAG TPA: hypothetical protein VN678_03090 [Acidobacteriaceae bacterium]|nr:hypothetical protein [Acidobacteriaceae bacterium]